MFNFIYEAVYENELGNKDLVQLLTDNVWSCCLKIGNKPVAINNRDHEILMYFESETSSNKEVSIYLIDKINKEINEKKGVLFRSPFYDIQKIHFEIDVQKKDGSIPSLDEFLAYFIKKGYNINNSIPN